MANDATPAPDAQPPRPTKPPFAYYGGKTNLAERIVDLLPPHTHYVEPFAGSLAVLLSKPRSKMETVNDLDQDLMTFWRVLREHPEDLARVCHATPHSRAEHQTAYDLADCSEIERARRVWVLLTQGRGGTLPRTGWRFYRDPAGSSYSFPDYLNAYCERMYDAAAARIHGVSLECRDALEVIEDYGRHPNVLLYVDPPYLATARNSTNYRHELATDAQHKDLASALRKCEAAVVLSGYASPLYEDLYDGWRRVEFPAWTGNGIRNGAPKTAGDRVEVLWSNREIGEVGLFDLLDGEAS